MPISPVKPEPHPCGPPVYGLSVSDQKLGSGDGVTFGPFFLKTKCLPFGVFLVVSGRDSANQAIYATNDVAVWPDAKRTLSLENGFTFSVELDTNGREVKFTSLKKIGVPFSLMVAAYALVLEVPAPKG